MLHESPKLQKPIKPMAKCHFHSILHSSPTPLAPCYRLEAANSQPHSWPVAVRSSLLAAAQHSGMTSLLATKNMPGGQLLLNWDSPSNLLLYKARSLACQGRSTSAAKKAVESLWSE